MSFRPCAKHHSFSQPGDKEVIHFEIKIKSQSFVLSEKSYLSVIGYLIIYSSIQRTFIEYMGYPQNKFLKYFKSFKAQRISVCYLLLHNKLSGLNMTIYEFCNWQVRLDLVGQFLRSQPVSCT